MLVNNRDPDCSAVEVPEENSTGINENTSVFS
jgi:hypothetical protein